MPKKGKRVGIFSGTFDPVHNGHLAFAQEAMAKAGLDKVFFLVEPRPRRKQGVKALRHRQAMVQLAIKDYKNLGSIVIEQSRFSTPETLPVLKAMFKGAQLCLLMGEDMLTHLVDWSGVHKLVKDCELVVGRRSSSEKEVLEKIENIQNALNVRFNYNFVVTNFCEISSSLVKSEIKKEKNPNLLPAGVYNYIKTEGLYVATGVS